MIQTVTAKQHNLHLLSNAHQPVAQENNPDINLLMQRLPMLLQTTLDLRELLQMFHLQLQPFIHQDSLSLQHQPIGDDVEVGKTARNSCHYALEINKQSLGTLTLTRGRRFNDEDIQLIEDLLCKMIYPLRNCQQYQLAVNAAMTDKLTGLSNREAFDIHINREAELAKRNHYPLSLLVVDIDYFKKINDQYGHNGGDTALKQVAYALNDSLRNSDVAFRYGGEEFTVVLSHCDSNSAAEVAERIRKTVSEIICKSDDQQFSITTSIGIAMLETDENADHFFDRADKAMYKAKLDGRNRVVQS